MFSGKKVLVVTTTDNMIWQFLLPHIKYLEDCGNTVECACNETGFWFKEMENNGINIKLHKVEFPRNPLSTKLLKSRKQLFSLVKENKYDLIICHQPVGGVMGRMAGHKFNIPVIYVAHGFHFYKGCPKKNLLYKCIEKHYSKYTDALVTMNEEDYQSALKFKAKKVYKINGIGVDLEKYRRDESFDCDTLRKEFGISENDFVIISVAELIKRKNAITLIKAVERLKNSNIILLLCGRGVLQEELQQYVDEHKLSDRVKFLGYRKDVLHCIQISNCLALASFHEGLPRCIMEAMVQGKPLVCSNIRGSKDLVGSDGGILVEPLDVDGFVDAFKKLSTDQNLCDIYGKRNKAVINEYSQNKVLEQMKRVYEEIEI